MSELFSDWRRLKKNGDNTSQTQPQHTQEQTRDTTPQDTRQDPPPIRTVPSQGQDKPIQEPNFGVISALPEEEYLQKTVVTVYGLKGEGKTTVAMNFSGEILCISFDRKSMRIKPMVPSPERIHVFDLMKYVDYTDTEKYGRALVVVFEETLRLLKGYNRPVDWVIIDGTDELARIAEAVMRYTYGLSMVDGVKNPSVWKYRRFILKQIHNAALTLARRGVIYTTYVDKEQTIEGQQIINSKDVPKWLDVIMLETDYVLRVRVEAGRYTLIIESGKGVKSQRKWDITDEKIREAIAEIESKI